MRKEKKEIEKSGWKECCYTKCANCGEEVEMCLRVFKTSLFVESTFTENPIPIRTYLSAEVELECNPCSVTKKINIERIGSVAKLYSNQDNLVGYLPVTIGEPKETKISQKSPVRKSTRKRNLDF